MERKKKEEKPAFKVSCERKKAFGLRRVHPQETASTLIKWGVLCEHRCILFSYEEKMIKLSETKIKNPGLPGDSSFASLVSLLFLLLSKGADSLSLSFALSVQPCLLMKVIGFCLLHIIMVNMTI